MALAIRTKVVPLIVSLTVIFGAALWCDLLPSNGALHMTSMEMPYRRRHSSVRTLNNLPMGGSPSSGKKIAAADVTSVPSLSAHKNHAWCPTSICHNSDLCHPCHRRFLIVLATGRSASTTLTWMLDSLPGVRMGGENADELKSLKTAIDNVRVNANWPRAVGQKSPWGHNPTPDGAFACVAQKMIETIVPPLTDDNAKNLYDDSRTIVGFKTVRFLTGVHRNETAGMARWLEETFPCARFLVNIRSNAEDQAKSWSKAFHHPNDTDAEIDQAAAHILDLNKQMQSLATELGESAYLLDSSDWVDNVSHLNSAISWLGFPTSCHFKELLEFNTDKDGYGNGNVVAHHNPDCRYEFL